MVEQTDSKAEHFDGKLISPSKSRLRSPAFNQQMAVRLLAWGESSDGAVDRVIDEIRCHFHGTYIDFEGRMRRAQDANVTYQFGEDAGRWMSEYFKKADKPYTRRLGDALTRRVMFIWLALEVERLRTGRSQ